MYKGQHLTYKIRRRTYRTHLEASTAAKAASRFLPVHLKTPTGGAWYWRGRYCGRHLRDIFQKKGVTTC